VVVDLEKRKRRESPRPDTDRGVTGLTPVRPVIYNEVAQLWLRRPMNNWMLGSDTAVASSHAQQWRRRAWW
jgi:hypothetical protein